MSEMSRVDTVKSILQFCLSVSERDEILEWLKDFDDDWDRQMEADAKAGHLDKLLEEVRQAARKGELRDLDELFQ